MTTATLPTTAVDGATVETSPPKPLRVVVASCIGSAFEIYDFTLFAFFAVVLAPAFFPAMAAESSLLLTAATFGIAAFVRPLGALFFGLYGDRIGRKPVLIITLSMMAIGSVTIGLTPKYETIGIWAPIIVAFARIMQGFSAGGEQTGAATFIAEHVPPEKRGFYLGFLGSAGLGASMFSAGIGLLLSTFLGEAVVSDWGWRIPFLLGGLVAPVGFYIRRKLPESEAFVRAAEEIKDHKAARPPLPYRRMLMLASIFIPATVTNYLGMVFMPTYLKSQVGVSLDNAFKGVMVGSALVIVLMPTVGALSDRFGRRTPLRLGNLLLLLGAYPLYLAVQGAPSAGRIIMIQCLFGILMSLVSAPLPTYSSEQFPTSRRALGMALSMIIPISLFGVCSPIIVTWLIIVTGTPLAPAFYLMAAALLGLVILQFLPETSPAYLRRRGAARAGLQ